MKDVLNFFLHNFPEATLADDLIISVVVLSKYVRRPMKRTVFGTAKQGSANLTRLLVFRW